MVLVFRCRAGGSSISGMCIHEVEVDELLLVQVLSCYVLEHVWEEGRHIFAQGHGHDGLLYGFLALPGILRSVYLSALDLLLLHSKLPTPVLPAVQMSRLF